MSLEFRKQFLSQWSHIKPGERANIFSMAGDPAPGLWRIPLDKYKNWLTLVSDWPCDTFWVETWSDIRPKVAFDFDDVPEPISLERFGKIIQELKTSLVIDREMTPSNTPWVVLIKESEPKKNPDGSIQSYSYHMVIVNRWLALPSQKELASRLADAIPELKGKVDPSIYSPKKGLRMIGSYKKVGDKRRMGVLSVFLDCAPIGNWQTRWKSVELLQMASIQIPVTPTGIIVLNNKAEMSVERDNNHQPEKEENSVAIHHIQEGEETPVPKRNRPSLEDLLDKVRIGVRKYLKSEVVSHKEIENGVQYRIRSIYCEIKGATHDREDGRCIIASRNGITYHCLDTECEGKSKKIQHIVSLTELAEYFPKAAAPPKKKLKVELSEPDESQIEYTPLQTLILYLFNLCSQRGYKRLGDEIHEPIILPGGMNTVAYRKVCTIEEFVLQETSIEKSKALWSIRSRQSTNLAMIVSELSYTSPNAKDLPLLVPIKSCFSYPNGYVYGNPDTLKVEWHPYPLDPNTSKWMIAANHFEEPFNEVEFKKPWRERKTLLDDTLRYQGIPENAIHQAYMFFGRTYFDVGQLERLGKNIIAIGESGAGKSLISEYLIKKYPISKVAIFSQNMQKTFGLAEHKNKYIWIAPDVRPGWSMDESIYNCITTGDPIEANIKHQSSKTIERWPSHGMITSNYLQLWMNKCGSAERRGFLLYMLKPFDPPVDPEFISRQMMKEYSISIAKDMEAYFELVQNIRGPWAKKDIFSCLDPYYTETKSMMASETNPLYYFIKESEQLEVDPAINQQNPALSKLSKVYCPLSVFKDYFLIWLKSVSSQFKASEFTWSTTSYTPVFARFGFVIADTKKKYPRGDPNAKVKSGRIIFGCDILVNSPPQILKPILANALEQEEEEEEVVPPKPQPEVPSQSTESFPLDVNIQDIPEELRGQFFLDDFDFETTV